MLMYGVDRDENQIAFFPIEALRFGRGMPFVAFVVEIEVDVPVSE
jgi:hypothetical protein